MRPSLDFAHSRGMSMSAKKVVFAALLGMCWSWCTAQAQDLTPPSTIPLPILKEGAAAPAKVATADEGGTGLSSWITYDRNNCCTRRGGGMPVLTEVIF